ncbi:MAG: hypothetical protein WBE83_05080 [Candidatus Cybelea sp.]
MSTLEKIADSGPARAPQAATAGPIPRQVAVPVVLSDFQRISMTEPREQEELKRIQAHFMTIAQSARKGLKSREEREELERVIAERMARYGASSQHIARRQVSVLTSRFVVPNPESDY